MDLGRISGELEDPDYWRYLEFVRPMFEGEKTTGSGWMLPGAAVRYFNGRA